MSQALNEPQARPARRVLWPLGLVAAVWPLLLVGLVDLGLESEAALVGLAVAALAVPALAILCAPTPEPCSIATSDAIVWTPAPISRPARLRTRFASAPTRRRAPRIVTPAVCRHCGRRPTFPRRPARIVARFPTREARIIGISTPMPARVEPPIRLRVPRLVRD